MNSFCLYLKISVLSFMNKALKIQPSIYWGRLPYPTPPGGFMFHELHLFFDFSVRRSCQFSHSPKTGLCVFFLSLTVQKRSISLSNQLNQHFPPSRVHFSRYFVAEQININKLIILRWSTSATAKQNKFTAKGNVTVKYNQLTACICTYSRLPITRTFKGNRKKVRVIESSKKIAESKVKNSFYCIVNILITFNCRNVK